MISGATRMWLRLVLRYKTSSLSLLCAIIGSVNSLCVRIHCFLALFLVFSICLAAQTSNQDIFTISVAAPTAAKDVQVRYFLSGEPAVQRSSSIAKPDENRIVVKTSVEGKQAKGFRAIIFAPGCQFATVQADDVAAGTRQAQFDCQKLTTCIARQGRHIPIFRQRPAGGSAVCLQLGRTVLWRAGAFHLAVFHRQSESGKRWSFCV
jgi:hypothetical protein